MASKKNHIKNRSIKACSHAVAELSPARVSHFIPASPREGRYIKEEVKKNEKNTD